MVEKSNTPKEIKDHWQTPINVFNALNREFEFTVDVCASSKNALCQKYYDEAQDALSIDWGKTNWCNPPYSNISPWVDKAINENSNGKSVVMLLPSDTSAKWFYKAYRTCNEVRFINGRLSFVNALSGSKVNGNTKGSVLFIWRAHCNSHCVSIIRRDDLN